MPNYIPNPFLEGQDNDTSEVLMIYNKNFKGIDMKYIGNMILFYKNTKSEKLKNILIEIVGENLFNLIIKEYVYDRL